MKSLYSLNNLWTQIYHQIEPQVSRKPDETVGEAETPLEALENDLTRFIGIGIWDVIRAATTTPLTRTRSPHP